MLFLGVDPGFTGALAVYNTTSGNLTIMDMPLVTSPKGRTEINMHALYDMLHIPEDQPVKAMLEFVAARPGQGAPATFRFGQGYGALQMAVIANKIPVQYVTPAVWKKHFGLVKDKGASRGLASQRFPKNAGEFTRVKDDGRAEAALIALYASEKIPH